MQKKLGWGVALVCALALGAPAFGGVGDDAPPFDGTAFYNTPNITMKDLRGQVILYEIFRTW